MSEDTKIIGWNAPSNIALIKYWGKRDNQLPENGSLSLTLNKSTTSTFLTYKKKQTLENTISIEYYFHGERQLAFESKTERLLNSLKSQMPFLPDYDLIFHSSNTFPHSAGIASSASSMCALALCLVTMEENISANKLKTEDFFRRASIISRLGSGSASRSIYGGFVTWGKIPSLENSSDEYATPYPVDPGSRLNTIRDIILIVSSNEKNVSSSKGHALMNYHPYRDGRKIQANDNMLKIIEAIRKDDYKTLADTAENEALALHALLMTSEPDGLLLKPGTLSIIEEVRKYRRSTGTDLFFTIDAGPNVHLIYFEDQREEVLSFVQNNLVRFCEDGQWIDDCLGKGPERISNESFD